MNNHCTRLQRSRMFVAPRPSYLLPAPAEPNVCNAQAFLSLPAPAEPNVCSAQTFLSLPAPAEPNVCSPRPQGNFTSLPTRLWCNLSIPPSRGSDRIHLSHIPVPRGTGTLCPPASSTLPVDR